MNYRNVILLSCIATILSSCATSSSNVRIGNETSYVSLADQRAASQIIQIFDSTPQGYTTLTKVEAGRCHRSFVENAPTKESLLLDLKVAAYAKGADAITDVKIEKKSGLTNNCWYVLDGAATALKKI